MPSSSCFTATAEPLAWTEGSDGDWDAFAANSNIKVREGRVRFFSTRTRKVMFEMTLPTQDLAFRYAGILAQNFRGDYAKAGLTALRLLVAETQKESS